MAGPCTAWATLGDAQELPGASTLADTLLLEALDAASELLYALSGRQFSGVCADVVRPCSASTGALYTQMVGGWWRWRDGWGNCACAAMRKCGCGRLSEITLGAYPLREITEVKVDGAVLDPSAYRIDDRRWLVRIDGEGWPCCQRLDLDVTEPDTFQVTFEWGQAPPPSGSIAAKVLGVEIAKALTGADCNLPARVQNVVRQGLSFTLLDPQAFLENGKTGLYLVDLFLTAHNPHRVGRRAAVISPDIPRPVRRTATTPGS